jgi:hypothetical protein
MIYLYSRGRNFRSFAFSSEARQDLELVACSNGDKAASEVALEVDQTKLKAMMILTLCQCHFGLSNLCV